MNKRLICLLMSILMLLTCLAAFAGCSDVSTEEEGESTVDNSAKTITMWVIKEEGMTPKAEELVNEAFTKITKAKFKTNVVIQFCTEDEYYAKLEETINAAQAEVLLEEEAAKALRVYLKAHKGEKDSNGETKDNATLTKQFYAENPQYAKFQKEEVDEDAETVETEEETEINEFGIAEIKYPEVKENQVDIFFVSGYDKYMEYYNAEWLSLLSEELNTSSKKLNDYISTSLLNGVQIEGGVYAIPNNVPIGEYTYMMIDKSLFDMYYQKIDKVGSVLDLSTFLSDINYYNGDKTPEDEGYVVPLASTLQECLGMLCWYWDLSYTDQSVYDMYYDEEKDRNYVLQLQYEVKEEITDAEGNVSTVTSKLISPSVQADKLYKTNEHGQFVDAQGNVLNYTYVTDPDGGWMDNGKKTEYSPEAKGALYLVDENGDPVTEQNDRRVVIEGETKIDANGYARPTYYYSYDENADFSILGTMMKDAADRNRGSINLGFNSLFTSTEYHEMYATLMDYDYKGYYGEVKEGQTAAVSFMKGDASIKMNYEKNGVYEMDGKEYYVVVAEYPEATEAELYGNMFAVYANSAHLARSMEVITYLNTNKELRDLLQYGILGQHYELNEDGTARLLTSSEDQFGTYRMDIKKTGNCFIATPTEELGPDAWTYAKIQNNDSLINPLLGFDFNTATADSDYSLDVELIKHIKELNAQALELINECTDKAELMELMSNKEDGFVRMFSTSAGDTKLNKAVNNAYDPEAPLGPDVPDQVADKSGSSPYTVYQEWLTTYGYLYVPAVED